jgi:DNA-binding Lrp family transcriptional regulator
MDALDRAIINRLQGGFPVSERPYRDAAASLGTTEDELMARLKKLLDDRIITRFGPLYHAEKLGGGLTLAAMRIPEAEFDAVAEIVNSYPEVAHNYARDDVYNMWFVVATETPEGVARVLRRIEQETGHRVYNMPKEHEFFVGLRFEA